MAAIISPCGLYRYRLERAGPATLEGPKPVLAVIMVNPSTADGTQDDQTIRKVRGFADRNGFGRIIVGNLFAFRATDVRDLRSASDPIGADNDRHLARIMRDADSLLFAWGPLAKLPRHLRDRWRKPDHVARLAGKAPLCLGVAQDGHPRHPLMVPYNQLLHPWSAP